MFFFFICVRILKSMSKKIMIHLFSVFVLCNSTFIAAAQNFNYTLSVEQGTYTPITNGTVISPSGNDWMGMNTKIGIGFPVSIMGKTFDSLRVSSSGYLVFDDATNLGFAYSGLPIKPTFDTTGQLQSSVRILNSGSTFSIAFDKIGFYAESENYYMSITVTIYSNGKIEIAFGENNFTVESWERNSKILGLINMSDLQNDQMALVLAGSANSPSLQSVQTGGIIPSIINWPVSGTHIFIQPN
jgi:hypothetical protein